MTNWWCGFFTCYLLAGLALGLTGYLETGNFELALRTPLLWPWEIWNASP